MNSRKIVPIPSTIDLNQLVEQWASRIVTGSLLLVLFTTLFPFDFSFAEGFSLKAIAKSFHHPTYLIDLLLNVLLFLPVGFSFTCLMVAKKLRKTTALIGVVVVSASLSCTIEILQVFLPQRFPTLTDIATNSFGGFLGFLCFHLWGANLFVYASKLSRKIRDYLTLSNLAIGFIGYATLAFLISILLQNSASLSTWDPSFPLLLGNEQTGDRPWQGYISEVYIADRAISKKEIEYTFSKPDSLALSEDSLIAAYQLTGIGSYPDQTGHLPALSWRGASEETQEESSALITPSHWLETSAPVSFLTQNIRKTSQFTLSATIATADTTQTGLARIISLSGDPYRRNFTLAQEGNDLLFRLRTPITGENGQSPELVVRGIFSDTHPHHLVITYSGAILQFYVDRLQNSYSFQFIPEVTFFRFINFLPSPLNASSMRHYKILYYALIFMPLGFIVGLLTTIWRGKLIVYSLIICGSLLFPSLLLEGIFAVGSGRSMSLENLLLSMAIMSGTMLLVKGQVTSWLNNNRVSTG